jgi:hypothetical protein
MAKGFPDYFGQSVWPKYGQMVKDTGFSVFFGAGVATLTTHTGQGVLALGNMKVHGLVPSDLAHFTLKVDGRIWHYVYLADFTKYGIFPGTMGPFVARSVRVDDPQYFLELSQPIVYGLSFDLDFHSVAGSDFTVDYDFIHYAV